MLLCITHFIMVVIVLVLFVNDAKSKDYTRYIKSGQLVMLSAEDPNCYFDVTNAIERNSYVCALSKYQIIVSSSINNGATWFTSLQNLHNKWTTPLAV